MLVLRRFAGTRTPTRWRGLSAAVEYEYRVAEYEYRVAEYEYRVVEYD